MNDLRSPLRRIALVAAVVVAALAMAGCSKKITSVDANFTAPEGQFNADARLIVYPDVPVAVEHWVDFLPDGPGIEDSLASTEQVSTAPGTLYGMILDGTPASGYQALRRESNGGYAQVKDYVLNPVVRFLESQWEVYTFSDGRPSGYDPPAYIGRGVVSGQVTPSSPLTNVSQLLTSSIPAIHFTADPFPRDSNFTMSWDAVPGAVGYWIQVYQYKGSSESQLLVAHPAPLLPTDTRNYFVGYVAAPATEYKLGGTGAMVLTRRTTLTGVEYLVKIVAVNDRGELAAFSYGDWEYIREAGFYRRYRVGAFKVLPTRPTL